MSSHYHSLLTISSARSRDAAEAYTVAANACASAKNMLVTAEKHALPIESVASAQLKLHKAVVEALSQKSGIIHSLYKG